MCIKRKIHGANVLYKEHFFILKIHFLLSDLIQIEINIWHGHRKQYLLAQDFTSTII